ncbi:hypothetical protein KEM52_003506, partial [Ascosphaera acerosa]
DLGSCEVYPQTLQHSPNGRFVSVCGDGEYIIYTALAWRNKAFGQAYDFAWAAKENSNDYAIRTSATCVKIFRNFKERTAALDVGFQAEGLTGGVLLGVKGEGGIGFFDWETGALVRRVEVEPLAVYWSESGELVTIASDDAFYVLRYSREAFLAGVAAGEADEEGVEAAFEIVTDVSEGVRTGQWVGDCFIYTTATAHANANNRLNYLVGDKTYTISHFDQPMYLLGYLPRDGKVYVANKDLEVTSFALSLAVVEYQTCVLRGDMDAAREILADIPAAQMNKIARFLEGQGFPELALEVATDPEQRFELALALGQLNTAVEIVRSMSGAPAAAAGTDTDTGEPADSAVVKPHIHDGAAEHKWKTIGDAALAKWQFALADECFAHARDLGSLLLLRTASNDAAGLRALAAMARAAGQNNVAFSALWHLADVDGCIDLLVATGRAVEAAFFAQTYKPERAAELLGKKLGRLDLVEKLGLAELAGAPALLAAIDLLGF